MKLVLVIITIWFILCWKQPIRKRNQNFTKTVAAKSLIIQLFTWFFKIYYTAFHMVLQNILDEGLKIINRRWSQMRDNKKTKHAKISKKWTYLTPLRPRTWAFQSIRNVCFFGKFGVLCFVVTSVLRFAFLPYYRPKLYIEKNSGKVSIKRSAQKRKASGTK